MQYRQYGKGGPMVSALGFGVMRLPGRGKDNWGSVCWSKAIPGHAGRPLDAGVNFFDTHHNYHEGLSEEAIGRMLKGWKGPRPIIQTKTPFYKDKPLDYFKRLIEVALKKTGVDCIDYLLFPLDGHGRVQAAGQAVLQADRLGDTRRADQGPRVLFARHARERQGVHRHRRVLRHGRQLQLA